MESIASTVHCESWCYHLSYLQLFCYFSVIFFYFYFPSLILSFCPVPFSFFLFPFRRFGESDADLSLEDKMFLRFQKERVKKARNVSLFNLDGGENVLTHKGK